MQIMKFCTVMPIFWPREMMKSLCSIMEIRSPCHHVKNTTPLMHRNLGRGRIGFSSTRVPI